MYILAIFSVYPFKMTMSSFYFYIVYWLQWSLSKKHEVQTCTIPKVCNIIFFTCFHLTIFFAARCLLKTKWLMKICILDQLNFIRQFVFRRQPAEFFFPKKIIKWKQVKLTNMILQRFDEVHVIWSDNPKKMILYIFTSLWYFTSFLLITFLSCLFIFRTHFRFSCTFPI